MDKIAMLTEILTQNPEDAFARYGLAMEHANQGQTDAALAEFERLLTTHPDYTPGYFMAAQTLVKAGRRDEAKTRLAQGNCQCAAHWQCNMRSAKCRRCSKNSSDGLCSQCSAPITL